MSTILTRRSIPSLEILHPLASISPSKLFKNPDFFSHCDDAISTLPDFNDDRPAGPVTCFSVAVRHSFHEIVAEFLKLSPLDEDLEAKFLSKRGYFSMTQVESLLSITLRDNMLGLSMKTPNLNFFPALIAPKTVGIIQAQFINLSCRVDLRRFDDDRRIDSIVEQTITFQR